MDKLLLDTCVWLDVAVDVRLTPLLDALERLCLRGALRLVVPDVVVVELDRNAEVVQQKTKRVLESLVREAHDSLAQVLGSDAERNVLRQTLGKVSSALPGFQGALNSRLRRVKTVVGRPDVEAQATTDDMMVSAFKRGLAKKAPFTKGKNSCGDSLILEHFDVAARSMDAGDRCVFVTSNKQDFGSPEDHRIPHPDIEALFNQTHRLYRINIAEHLKAIDSTAISPSVVIAAQEAGERMSLACPAGGEHDFDPEHGATLRSPNGGFSWHLFCRKCGVKVDTSNWER